MRHFITIIVLFLGLYSYAQKEDSIMISKIADEVLIRGTAYENLRNLTKKVGSRLTASPGYYKAETWGQQALRDAGADKVYLQECTVLSR